MDVHEVIDLPIKETGLSAAWVNRSGLMGFETLREIILTDPRDLTANTAFSYHWLAELSEFLQSRQLLHLLQPIPGKSSC